MPVDRRAHHISPRGSGVYIPAIGKTKVIVKLVANSSQVIETQRMDTEMQSEI